MEIGILYLLDIVRYYLGLKFLFKKKFQRLWIPVIGEMICLIIAALYGNNKVVEVIAACVYFMSFLSILIMIEGELKERLLNVIGVFAFYSCLDELIGYFFNKIFIEALYEAILECAGSIILLVILLLFQKIKSKIKIKRIWITFFVVLASIWETIIMFVFSREEYIQTFSGQLVYKVMLLIGYGCLLGLIVVAFYTKEQSQKDQKFLNMEKYINEMQKNYYLSLLEREADTRRYRHDINNHLMCLRALVDGNIEAQNYIDNLQEKLYVIKNKFYETGFELMNILLGNHLSEIEKNVSISLVGKIMVKPDISDVDFCTIFSNLLSNAVEEVNRAPCTNPYIKIEIKTGKVYLMITIRNSSTVLIEDYEQNLMTKKQDKKNHGIGLRNVRETVCRNNGRFSLEGNGEEVSAKVILNLKSTIDGVI